MRKILALLAVASVVIMSCNSYGDKVKVNDKSEVYYKDGANKEEAQKLGEFLLKNNYFDDKSEKSVQLTKSSDTFNVKFVVDKEKVDKQENSELLFQILGSAISSEVFNNKPVKVILADQYMKGFKDIMPFALDSSAEATDTTTAATEPTTTTADSSVTK